MYYMHVCVHVLYVITFVYACYACIYVRIHVCISCMYAFIYVCDVYMYACMYVVHVYMSCNVCIHVLQYMYLIYDMNECIYVL